MKLHRRWRSKTIYPKHKRVFVVFHGDILIPVRPTDFMAKAKTMEEDVVDNSSAETIVA